jgi:hypothetical protein
MISSGVRTDSIRCDRAAANDSNLCCAIALGYNSFRGNWHLSQVQETLHYIEPQLEHHRTRTFQEEYLAFLKNHGAHFDEKYLRDQLRRIIPYPTGRSF